MNRHPIDALRRHAVPARALASAVAAGALAVGGALGGPPGSLGAPGAPGTSGVPAAPGTVAAAPATPAAHAQGNGGSATTRPGSASLPAAPRAADPAIAVTGVDPTIATPGVDVTVDVTLRNTTQRRVDPSVRVGIGSRLRTRADVADHAAEPSTSLPRAAGATVAALEPGEERTIALRIPANRLGLPRPYGVLPITVSVSGLPDARPVASFLPYQVVKEYQPLRVGVALPVTADPQPALLAPDPAERLEARTRMVAEGSRLDRILTAGILTDATLVVDPTLLGDLGRPARARATSGAAPSPSGTTTPTTTPSGATASPPESSGDSDAGLDATDPDDPGVRLARRLATAGADVWFVPPGDPDVSALASATSDATLPRLPEAPATLPGTQLATPTVDWPAGTASSQVRGAIAASSPQPPAAVIMQGTRTDADSGRTGSAAREDGAGRRILAVDDRMSALLGGASGPAQTSSVTQRVLADSVALLAESPGLTRSVMLLPDRSLDPDPDSLARAIQALRTAPWVTPVSGGDLLALPSAGRIIDATTPPQGSASPIDARNLDDVRELSHTTEGLRPSFGDGNLLPDDAGEVLVSTRWRGHPAAWSQARQQLAERVATLSDGVRVVPSAINFFAEHGALQVTVVNDLDVEVRDVRLTTDVQGRPPRLIVHSAPQQLTIRPRSRATVRLDTEAVAAGVVPVTASLRTQAGTPLGEDATVRVRVQPTNGWLLLAAGGVVGIVFVFGLFRAIRAGERRVAAADLEGLDLR